MIESFSSRAKNALFALSLIVCMPTYAQEPPSPALLPNGADYDSTHGQWNSENFNRQIFREEMVQIRKEHEELEAASDQLNDQCTNSTPQQLVQCKQERDALHDKRIKLHERMRALREQMQAVRQEHGQSGGVPRPPVNGNGETLSPPPPPQ